MSDEREDDASTSLTLRNSGVFETRSGVFLAPRNDLVTKHLIEFGAHTGPFVELALTMVDRGDLVVDVGGHIGTYTIPLARRVAPTGRVLAFEPNPLTREILEINVELNDLAHVVVVADVAVGSQPGTASLHVSRANTGAARLDTDDSVGGEVRVDTLDSVVVGSPSLLKIDAEGFELQVLRGAVDLLDRAAPAVLVEIDRAQLERFGDSVVELQEFLRARGYEFFTHLGARNTAEPGYQLARVDDLTDRDELFDVLAVPQHRVHRLGELEGRG